MPQDSDSIDLYGENGPDWPHVNGSERLSDAELESMGITFRAQFLYEWGGYRYSNLGDAISAAKRGKKADFVSGCDAAKQS